MDEETLARLKRAAGPKPTGPAGPHSPRVVRRSDLVEAITELEHCADGTAFDADDEVPDLSTAQAVEARIEYHREQIRRSFGGRA